MEDEDEVDEDLVDVVMVVMVDTDIIHTIIISIQDTTVEIDTKAEERFRQHRTDLFNLKLDVHFQPSNKLLLTVLR